MEKQKACPNCGKPMTYGDIGSITKFGFQCDKGKCYSDLGMKTHNPADLNIDVGETIALKDVGPGQ